MTMLAYFNITILASYTITAFFIVPVSLLASPTVTQIIELGWPS